jgi:hypothetical protein
MNYIERELAVRYKVVSEHMDCQINVLLSSLHGVRESV